ncbi:MAG: hypothetical protein NT062_16810, partial [Proteobacteria bacterium]|nr:hypothetical protein [Pseudomonadota bacterium]
EARLDQLDLEAARFQGRLSALVVLGYLGFVPFMLWTGVRQPWLVAAFAILTLVGGAQVYRLSRRSSIQLGGIYLNAVINASLIALVTRLVGPFLIAPTLVATTLMAYAVHPRFGKIGIVAVIVGAGVAVPWLLEVVGILPSTYHFEHGDLVMVSPALSFSSIPTQLAFAALLVSVLGIVALLARNLAMRQRDIARRIELQSWQLRQLVPARV